MAKIGFRWLLTVLGILIIGLPALAKHEDSTDVNEDIANVLALICNLNTPRRRRRKGAAPPNEEVIRWDGFWPSMTNWICWPCSR